MRHQIAACLLLIGSVVTAAQQHETQLFELNAYDPVPSPDGKLIAYVLTGRKLSGGSGGFGRSNLQSDVKFCDPSGQTLQSSNVEGFLGEWMPDSSALVGYRDWRFSVLSPSGRRESGSTILGRDMNALLMKEDPERVAYRWKLHKFIWIEHTDTSTILQTAAGPIAEFKRLFVRTPALNHPPSIGNFSTRFSGSWTAFDSFKTPTEIHSADLLRASASFSAKAVDQQIVLNVVGAYQSVLSTRNGNRGRSA